jgi:hypothetical protein
LRFVLLNIWFYVYVLYIIAFPFVLFHLVIVLSFLLQITASGHPFDIFKLLSLHIALHGDCVHFTDGLSSLGRDIKLMPNCLPQT